MNAPTTTTDQLSQSARRLEALVRRTAAFVTQQLGQLDDIGLQIAAEARERTALDADPAEHDSEWIRQKADDEQRIEEQLEHLAKAWKELESEQRRLMMLERGTSGPATENAATSMDEPATAGLPEPPSAVQETLVRHRSRDLIDESAPQDAAAATLQFQKLKREIRQQARRQR